MNNLEKVERAFYERDTLLVAQDLLGKYLIHRSSEGTTIGRIAECEAYMGLNDPAAHSYKGRKTKRTQIQFGPGGHAYIYFIYGMYFCFNIVTQKSNMPEVVLIRALEPIEGIELMSKRRKLSIATKKDIKNIANGPSKLCSAMGINKSLYGADLCGDVLFLAYPPEDEIIDIISTPRINIDYAGEARYYPWRFYIRDNEFVSRSRSQS